MDAERVRESLHAPSIPAGVTRQPIADGVEYQLKRTHDPGFGMAAVVLIVVGVGVSVAGIAGGFQLVAPIISGVSLVGSYGLYQARQNWMRRPAQKVSVTQQGIAVDAGFIAWTELQAVHRGHGNSGGSLIVQSVDGRVLSIGGRMRPSGVDWFEGEIDALRPRQGMPRFR
ncbi:MAG: hypothetical protein AB8H79_26995 [Myxococcota bacterium]